MHPARVRGLAMVGLTNKYVVVVDVDDQVKPLRASQAARVWS